MERAESQSRRERFERARSEGYNTDCIGKKCVCWWFCSHYGRSKPPFCDSDLSTGFFHRFAKRIEGEGKDYRDPERAGHSGVFKKKKRY